MSKAVDSDVGLTTVLLPLLAAHDMLLGHRSLRLRVGSGGKEA
jgi:hypothetical protein